MRSPNTYIDYTSRDYESFRSDIIKGLVERVPTYSTDSQNDVGIAIIEALSERLDVLSYYIDSMANEAFITTCQQRSSAESWCRILGYTPYSSVPSTILQCFELFNTSNTDTVIPTGTIIKTQDSEPIIFETIEDLIIPAGCLGTELREDYNSSNDLGLDGGASKYKFLVGAIQGYTVSLSYVGTPSGYPNSKYILKHSGIVSSSVKVSVFNGNEYEDWTYVDSFIDSLPTSKHFSISLGDLGASFVLFGDGNTGMIPPISAKPIYASYRVGGGTVGNVTAETVTVCDYAPLKSVVRSTFNPANPIVYGREAESLSSIRTNAPIYSSVRWGIVTLKDFDSFITINYKNKVLSSKTVYDIDSDTARVYIVVNPYFDFTTLKSELLNTLTEHLILKGKCDVIEAPQELLNLSVSINILDGFKQDDIKSSVEYFINDYFLVGHLPQNTEVILSDLCESIKEKISGIRSIKFTAPVEDVINTTNPYSVLKIDSLSVEVFGGVV